MCGLTLPFRSPVSRVAGGSARREWFSISTGRRQLSAVQLQAGACTCTGSSSWCVHMCVVRLEWRCSRMRARSCPARNLVICTRDRVMRRPAGVLLAVSRLARASYCGNRRDLAHYPCLLLKLRKRVSSALTGSEAAANAARSPVRGGRRWPCWPGAVRAMGIVVVAAGLGLTPPDCACELVSPLGKAGAHWLCSKTFISVFANCFAQKAQCEVQYLIQYASRVHYALHYPLDRK